MIYITLDITDYNEKPDKKEIAKINQRLKTGLHGISNLYAIAEAVGDNGYTWCPAVFEGARKIDNFKSIQIIALDFDGGVTFDEISERSKKYMIPILFAYETFSAWNADKFRIAILLEEKITKKEEFDTIIAMLMKIFPECDKSCKDVSRMFFGGKRLMYYNYDEIPLDKKTLAMNFALYMKNTYGSKHYKERIRSMFKNGANSPGIVYNKTTNGENAPKGHRAYRQDILSKLCNTCRLYNEFINDNEWLYYNQLYGLATNLIHVETGSKCFLNTIQNSQFETYKRD